MKRALLLAASSALALAASGCGGGAHGTASSGAGGSDRVFLAAVKKAADVTGQVPGYKFSISIDSELAGKSTTIAGTGSSSEGGAQGSFDMRIGGTTIAEIIDKPYLYLKLPSGKAQTLTGGKAWARANLSLLSESVGASSLGGPSADPTQTLDFLESAGTVTRVGSEAVRGVPATHYHAVIDLDRSAAAAAPAQRAAAKRYAEVFKRASGGSSLPIDVWIDQSSHVSRMSLSLSLCARGIGLLHESLNYELYGYGPQQVPAPPPASQVADVNARLKSQIAQGLAQLGCK